MQNVRFQFPSEFKNGKYIKQISLVIKYIIHYIIPLYELEAQVLKVCTAQVTTSETRVGAQAWL